MTLVVLTVFNTSCLKTDDDEGRDQALIEDYLVKNNLQANIDQNGIYFIPMVTNPDGMQVKSGNVVSIYYSMSLLDGTFIDEFTSANGEAKKFRQGVERVAPIGLDLGVLLMRTGEIFKLILPSRYAYGSNQFGTLIPADAIIILDVEVDEVWNIEEHKDVEDSIINAFINDNGLGTFTRLLSGLYIREISTGNGTFPGNLDQVAIRYEGRFMGGELFDSSDLFTFVIGESEVIPGFEEGVLNTEYGGRSIIFIPSHLAYGESDFIIPQQINGVTIPPYSILRFDIEVLN